MAKKLSPGIDPDGHPAMAKVKLEGPKKHHDNHGKDASVPCRYDEPITPKMPFTKMYSLNRVHTNAPGNEMNPKRGRDRPSTHTKVNETDH